MIPPPPHSHPPSLLTAQRILSIERGPTFISGCLLRVFLCMIFIVAFMFLFIAFMVANGDWMGQFITKAFLWTVDLLKFQ